MNEKDIVITSLNDPKCQPIKGSKENDDWFLSTAWALEINQDMKSDVFKHIQQKIFRFLQKHSSSETLFRLRREYADKNKAESAKPIAMLFDNVPVSENILDFEDARVEIKKAKEQIK